MLSDKELLDRLNDMLDDLIKTNLKSKGKLSCEKELQRLRGSFNQVINELSPGLQKHLRNRTDRLSEITNTIQDMVSRIAAFEKTQETELHGVRNYSAYEDKRVQTCAYKVILKKKLQEMLALIYYERPNLRAE